jgi:hypothetical protein
MTTITRASSVSLLPTTASALPESVRSRLAPVPESRGTPVVVLAPVTVAAPLPPGFVEIDDLVETAEKDPVSREAIAAGRRAVAGNYYADEPRSLTWYRLNKGWSQKELASRMSTSQSYIARLEAGAIDPQVSTVARLASVLGVTAAELLEALAAGGIHS